MKYILLLVIMFSACKTTEPLESSQTKALYSEKNNFIGKNRYLEVFPVVKKSSGDPLAVCAYSFKGGWFDAESHNSYLIAVAELEKYKARIERSLGSASDSELAKLKNSLTQFLKTKYKFLEEETDLDWYSKSLISVEELENLGLAFSDPDMAARNRSLWEAGGIYFAGAGILGYLVVGASAVVSAPVVAIGGVVGALVVVGGSLVKLAEGMDEESKANKSALTRVFKQTFLDAMNPLTSTKVKQEEILKTVVSLKSASVVAGSKCPNFADYVRSMDLDSKI